jgi:N-acetylglucosamine-6-sulfatase
MRQQLNQRLKETGGLAIPLGFKRNHGSNQRSATGSKRAEFPEEIIHGPAIRQRSD